MPNRNDGRSGEIRIDGTPRSHRDRKDFVMEAARLIKIKNPRTVRTRCLDGILSRRLYLELTGNTSLSVVQMRCAIQWALISYRIDVVYEAEHIRHREAARGLRRKRRFPVLHLPKEGIVVAVHEADEDFRDDRRSHRPEPQAIMADFSLLEDIVPERRGGMQPLLLGDCAVGGTVAVGGDLGRSERVFDLHVLGHVLARWQSEIDPAFEVSQGEVATAAGQRVQRFDQIWVELSRGIDPDGGPAAWTQIVEAAPVDDPVARQPFTGVGAVGGLGARSPMIPPERPLKSNNSWKSAAGNTLLWP